MSSQSVVNDCSATIKSLMELALEVVKFVATVTVAVTQQVWKLLSLGIDPPKEDWASPAGDSIPVPPTTCTVQGQRLKSYILEEGLCGPKSLHSVFKKDLGKWLATYSPLWPKEAEIPVAVRARSHGEVSVILRLPAAVNAAVQETGSNGVLVIQGRYLVASGSLEGASIPRDHLMHRALWTARNVT